MKIEDIKRMAQAWNQVQEASYGKKKEAMDPVDQKELKGKHKDRKDKDIDNDGDVDKSDEYLHKRRKAVSKAIKGKGTETEVQTQESFAGLQEAFTKRTVHGADYKKKSGEFNTNLPGRMYTFIDNGNHSILVQVWDGEATFGVFELKDPNKPSPYPQDHKLTAKNKPLLVKSLDKVFYVLLQGIKKHNIKEIKIDGNYPRGMSKEYDKLIANKAFLQELKKVGMEYAGKVGEYYHFAKIKNKPGLTKEAKELDELSKKTLGSYVKKASGNMAGKTAVQAVKVTSSGKYDPDLKRGLVNRSKGIGRAADKLTKEAKDHGNTNNGSPAGEGLSPSAKKELANKTPMPDAVNEPMVDKKTFDAIRASGKKAPMRSNDNAQGDKTPPKAGK